MSEKPQTARGDEDLLEQIITQGLEKVNAPAQAAAAEETPPEAAASAPEREGGGGSAPPTGRKTRQSAVYLYLLILFGAAFLMLLLAYFVQRRSSEDAISGLRDSMNLSRQELLDQIRELEEQNTELNERITEQRGELSNVYVERAQWQRLYEEAALEAADFYDQVSAAQEALYSWDSFWTLEQFYQAEDLEGCAAILIVQLQGQYTYRTPNGAEQRYEEIVRAVIGAGILDEDYVLHPEDYGELFFSSVPAEWQRENADR